MANDKNKNDWFIANLSSPNNTLGDFAQEGLDNSNIQLLGREDYKNSEKVRTIFTDEEGTFDEDSFNKFYDHTAQTYNTFSKDNFDKTVLNSSYFGERNIFVDPNSKRLKQPFSFRKVKNPLGDIQGIEGNLMKTESPFSLREIAQKERIWDSTEKKFLDETPNDLGFLGSAFNRDTYVLAQWDEDGVHYDEEKGTQVQHGKGELKYNDRGRPFYEQLKGREVYGKDVLSPWDVMTIDGSMGDKWNFMSGDDKQKSVIGNLTRSAAYIAPYFIPGVGQYYAAFTLGNAILTDLLPTLTKAGIGLVFNERLNDTEFMKSMNTIQGWNRRWRPSTSDYGQQSIFNVDNFSTMISDVFGQLSQQRAIAKIPVYLGMKGKEVQAFSMAMKGKSPSELTRLSNQYKTIRDISRKNGFLRDNFGGDKKIADMLNKWDLWTSNNGKYLGVAYMAGIASTGIAEEAKIHGFDERDTAMMFLGTLTGMGALMSKMDYMSWALKGIGFDDVEQFMKRTIKDSASKINVKSGKVIANITDNPSALGAGLSASTDNVEKKSPAWLFRYFKGIGEKMSRTLSDGDYATISAKAMAEGMEEMTEEGLMDSMKLVFNGLKGLNLTSTEASKVQSFDFDDMLSRYTMAAIGGAAGGSIAGIQDKLAGHVHSTLPPNMKKEIISIFLHGYEQDWRAYLDDMHKRGKLGSTTLSPVMEDIDYKLTSDPVYKAKEATRNKVSQNDFVYDLMTSHANFIKRVIFQEGGEANLLYSNLYKNREQNLTDFSYTTPIQEDIESLVDKIADVEAEIAKVKGGTDETNQKVENDESAKDNLSGLEADKKKYRDELNEILSGDRRLYYTEVGLFSSQRALYDAYDVKSPKKLAYDLYKKRYEDLTTEEAKNVDELYSEYKDKEKKAKLLIAYQKFKKDAEVTNSSAEVLQKYSNQKRALFANANSDLEGYVKKLEKLNNTLILEKIGNLNPKDVMASIQTDPRIEQENISVVGTIDNLIGMMAQEQYINPELKAYIDTVFDVNMTPYVLDSSGDSTREINNLVRTLLDAEFYNPELSEFDIATYSPLIEAIDGFLSEFDKITPNNFNEFVEKVKNIEEHIDLDEVLDDLSSSFDGSYYSESPLKNKIKSTILGVFKNLPETFQKQAFQFNAELNQVIPLEYDSEENPYSLYLKKLDYDKLVSSKKTSPLHDLIGQFAEIDGQQGVQNLFDSLNKIYDEFQGLNTAAQFVLDDDINKQQLHYANDVIERVKATILAASNYNSVLKQIGAEDIVIGYNDALNKVEDLGLPVFLEDDSNFLLNEADILKGKIEFLINLSEFNSAGTIREAKHTGVRVMTLEIDAINTHLEALKNVGFNTEAVEDQLENLTEYHKNINLIKEDENSVLSYDNDSFSKLRQEKDALEKVFYDTVNSDNEFDVKLRKLFDGLSAEQKLYELGETDVQLSSNITSLPSHFQFMYLSMISNTDPKQFYIDYYGNVPKDEYLMEKHSPFYTQELTTKILYWSVMSKFKTNNTFKSFSDAFLPKEDKPFKDRNPLYDSAEDLTTLSNFIFLNGIPGAGKSSTVLKHISRILSKYNLNLATYAPYLQQVGNMNESLEISEANHINKDQNILIDLFNSISPEVTAAIEASKDKLVEDLTEEDAIIKKIDDEEIKQRSKDPNFDKFKTPARLSVVLNRKHKAVKKFLNDFTTLRINGKIPNVILIDEATHILNPYLELLSIAVEETNKRAKDPKDQISVITVGDSEQSGSKFNAKNNNIIPSSLLYTNILSTPVLDQSFRIGNNLLIENLRIFKSWRATTVDDIKEGLDSNQINKKLTLKHKEIENILYGHKIVDDFDLNYVKNQIQKYKSLSTEGEDMRKKVAILTDKEDSDLLNTLKSNFSDEDYRVLEPSEIQGLEFDFVIIDLEPLKGDPSLTKTGEQVYTQQMKDIYTYISRSKNGTLINSSLFNPKVIEAASTDQDVNVRNIKLDEEAINNYKKFNRDDIGKAISALKDSPQYTSLEVTTTSDDDKKQDLLMNRVLEVVVKQLEKGYSEKDVKTLPFGPDDSIYEGDEAYGYMFHEHLGFSLTNDKIDEVEQYKTDAALVYELLTGERIKTGLNVKDADLVQARQITKMIKLALMNKVIGKVDDVPSYLIDAGVEPSLLREDGPLGNINNYEFQVMTKDYIDEFDGDPNTESKSPKGGKISYLVAVDPNSWYDNAKTYTSKFVVAALPNIKNPNVIKKAPGTVALMEQVFKAHDEYIKNNFVNVDEGYTRHSFFKLNKPKENITRWSNLVLDKSKDYGDYEEFLDDHRHLRLSEPLVVIDDTFVYPDALDRKKDPEGLNDQIKNFTKTLNGKTVVLVSDNLSLQPSEMMEAFTSQVKNHRQYLEEGKTDPNLKTDNDIRLVVLNPKGNKFSKWIEANEKVIKQLYGLGSDVAEFRGTKNDYAAAKMLARLMLIVQDYYINKDKETFYLPVDITHNSNGVYDPKKTQSFINSLEQFLDVAIPATIGKDRWGFLFEMMGEPVPEENVKKLSSEKFRNFINEQYKIGYAGALAGIEGYENTQFSQITEHFIARELLRRLGDVNLNTPAKIVDAGLEPSDLETIRKESNIRNRTKQGLYNMTSAFRVAFYGGKINFGKKGQIKKTEYIKSAFQRGDNSIDEDARVDFMEKLDLVLTGSDKRTLTSAKSSTTNKPFNYVPLFPDGIHQHITFKKKDEENTSMTETFAVPYANTYKDLKVNVRVQEPKLSINLDLILDVGIKKADEQDDILSQNYKEFKSEAKEIKQKFNTFVRSKGHLFYNVDTNAVFNETFGDIKSENDLKERLAQSDIDHKQLIKEGRDVLLEHLNTQRFYGIKKGAKTFITKDKEVYFKGNELTVDDVSISESVEAFLKSEWIYNNRQETINRKYSVADDNTVIVHNDIVKNLVKLIYTPDTESFYIKDTLWKPREIAIPKEILKQFEEIRKMTQEENAISLLNDLETISKLEVIPVETQQELGRKYLKARLEAKKAGDAILDKKIQDVYKKITDLKQC